jgi:hypothetical protein
MSKSDDFRKCTVEKTKDGIIELSCALGLWSVSGVDVDIVYMEGYHYWQQYNDDGEYYKIIGGESPAEKAFKR